MDTAKHAGEFRRCLEELDVEGVRRLYAHVSSHLPQPKNDHEALASLHMARTQSPAMAPKLRCYSHRWLTERSLPSQLPDEMKPLADRLYPRVVEGVGIGVACRTPEMRPVAEATMRAMEAAVEDCYANGDTAPELVTQRIEEARQAERRRIFGPTGLFSFARKG